MEGKSDVMSYLLHGCSLARNLESNLSNVASNHPDQVLALTQQCDEIIRVFTVAQHHLNALHALPLDHHHCPYQPGVAAMATKTPEMCALGYALEEEENEGSFEQSKGAMEAGGSSSSAQLKNPKRSSRKDDQEVKKQKSVRVAAPQIGNMDAPPDDGFTWRKYGQKEILRAKYPRSYYRCTYQKLYNCPAKKQVQRLDDDPSTFEILYRGDHTCHIALTVPSTPRPSSHTISPQKPIPTVQSTPHQWLLVDYPRPLAEGANTVSEPPMLRLGSSPGNYDAPAPSAVGSDHQGIDIDDFLNQTVGSFVADEMINYGSSTSNSMEIVFPVSNDKWETKDRRD